MHLDILQDSFIKEYNSDSVILYNDLVNTPLSSGITKFKLDFDFNINVSTVQVELSTLSGVVSTGFYGEIKDLGDPCVHYPADSSVSTVDGFLDLNFDNHGTVAASGVVCSGIYCNNSSYTVSEPYFMFSCSYTTFLYVKKTGDVTGVSQDNMFFRAEGPYSEILSLGVTSNHTLSLLLFDGTSEILHDTGLPFLSNQWNLISLRCSPKTKLRVGCRDSFIEINKSCAFLGGSSVTYLGGRPGVGYFQGILSDFTWWPNYADNIFIEYAITHPSIVLNGQKRPISVITTSSGVLFDLDKNYPSRIYIELDFPTTNVITGISVNTYDSDYTLTTSGGSDTLFCGTVVRGYTSTNFPIALYNHTSTSTNGYVFPYDANRYKALSVSNDGENYSSNQISLPQDVSWTSGENKSGINNDIVLDTPYNTGIDSNKKIVLHDNSRRCLWYLSKTVFGFYDLRTKNDYTRNSPPYITQDISNTRSNWIMDSSGNYIYLICYEIGVYKYNIITNTWSLLTQIPYCDNVCISSSFDYIFFSYYYNTISKVFRYNLTTGSIDNVCSFNISSIKIESNRDSLFVLAGNIIFKYDVTTLNVVSSSQQVGLSNILEIKDICGYISIITTAAVYSLSYSQEGWGSILKVYNFSSSFSISYVGNCSQYIAFVKSNDVYLARLSHYRYISTTNNILNNYNNTLSLLPLSPTARYKEVWGWLDTEEAVPNFYIASKFSMSESIVYGFARNTSPTMSIFMSFNSITKKYITLSSVVPGNLIDIEHGCLVETYDKVYYINFNKGHYYKYVISENIWYPFSVPKTYGSVSNCTVVSAVWDLDKKIYVAGESKGGYYGYQSSLYVANRYYSFFGYIDIDTDILHSTYYLPYVSVFGKSSSGGVITPNGSSFTCDLNYNFDNKYLFLTLSQYTSRAVCYMHALTIDLPVGQYVFDSLEDLYDYGCIIYNPFTGSKFNNLMNNYYFYIGYGSYLESSDIPGRDSLHLVEVSQDYLFVWTGGSIGLKTNYEFSVHARVKIPDRSTYMPIILDSPSGGKYGFEVGFDNNDIIVCCRKEETYLGIIYPMASAGIAKDDWVDLGASLSCVSGTYINLYINGNNIASSGIVTTCSGYTSDAELHFLSTKGSPYMDDSSSFYYNYSQGNLTEFAAFNRILSDQEFSDISYAKSNKPIARILMDYNKTKDVRLPQSSYEIESGDPPVTYDRYDGTTRLYSIYDYTSSHIYYLSDYTFIRASIHDLSTDCVNLRAAYNSFCDKDIEYQEIKNCFIATGVNTVVGQLAEYGLLYIGDVFDDSTRYYDTGSFVSPVIDVGDTGIIAYNFEYSLARDAYLEFYIRYANDKPVDFCHMYYVDSSNNFIESSLATGKVFYTAVASLPNSCDVYYNDTFIKVTLDGNVYNGTNYTAPIATFSLAGYTLADVSSTHFSYNGSYILYYTSDKYLVGFPLSVGLPCMRTSVTYNSIEYVAWSKYAQQLAVTTNAGVYVYNYMLGEVDYVVNAYRIFYIYSGTVVINRIDSSVLLNNSGVYYSYVVSDIDFTKNIEFDYTTEWIYYVTLSGNLKAMHFISSEQGFELEFLSSDITYITDIYKVTFDYILLEIDAKIVTYTKNGFIAVSDYPFPVIQSGNIVFFDYNPTNKTTYYNLNYLSNNDLVWSDLLDWISLGSKSSGFIIGKRYVQLKVVFKTSSNKNATPILHRIHFSSPTRVGPILPHTANNFYVKLDVPLDDQGDIYSVKLITLAEDIVR